MKADMLKGNVAVKQSPRNLFIEFENIYRSIAEKAFAMFEGNGRVSGYDLDDWFKAESEILHPLHLKLTETDNNFAVRAEVPGFTPKDIEINAEARCITIAGKRETKSNETKGKMIRSECCSDQILRTIDLPADIDISKASATLREGMLTINLPKRVPSKAMRIKAKVS